MKGKPVIYFVFAIVLLIIICNAQIVKSESAIIKHAVKEKDIEKEDYIFCKRARVTGFDWILVQDEDGNPADKYCNIIGIDPFEDLQLNHDFVIADNIYVFYIENKNEYYSSELQMNCIEYSADFWDILYPVKHGGVGFAKTSKGILNSDKAKN